MPQRCSSIAVYFRLVNVVLFEFYFNAYPYIFVMFLLVRLANSLERQHSGLGHVVRLLHSEKPFSTWRGQKFVNILFEVFF